MRNFGIILLIFGILAFVYASSRLDDMQPLPEGLSISESLKEPAGRWQMARYVFAGGAGFGLLMALFPKGR
jgi:hypothetical protein